MSEPRKVDEGDKIDECFSGSRSECISAMSALNMEPCASREDERYFPCDFIKEDDSPPYFLADVDYWAKHTLEHIRSAMYHANMAEKKFEKLKRDIEILTYKIEDVPLQNAILKLLHPDLADIFWD